MFMWGKQFVSKGWLLKLSVYLYMQKLQLYNISIRSGEPIRHFHTFGTTYNYCLLSWRSGVHTNNTIITVATWQYLFSHVLQKIIKTLSHCFKIDQHAITSYFKILAGPTDSRKNSYDKLLVQFTFNIWLMNILR